MALAVYIGRVVPISNQQHSYRIGNFPCRQISALPGSAGADHQQTPSRRVYHSRYISTDRTEYYFRRFGSTRKQFQPPCQHVYCTAQDHRNELRLSDASGCNRLHH